MGSLVGEGSGGAPAGTGLLGGAQVGHFIQGESSRNRCIKGLNRGSDWDRHDCVAIFPQQPAQALALSTNNNHQRVFSEGEIPQRSVSAPVQSDGKQSSLAVPLDGLIQVGYSGHGDPGQGTSRSLPRRSGH